MLSKALTVVAIVLVFVLGILLGRIHRITMQVRPPVTIRTDRRPGIPVVRIDGVVDGHLTGVLKGEVRLLLGTVPVVAAGVEVSGYRPAVSSVPRPDPAFRPACSLWHRRGARNSIR